MNTESSGLALDIGGANIKAAHTRGAARSVPFALWKHSEQLPTVLASLIASYPRSDWLAVTMTAELCDCYATKAVGVRAVLDAVAAGSPPRRVRVWGIDGGFHSIEAIRERPELAAAANWLALATVAARLVPGGPGLLIDVGSTTTDLVPILGGRPVMRGRTDTDRLRSGELVYAGVLRTPFCALANELPFRGAETGLAAELFASTLDVYLTLGFIPPEPNNHDTADGRARTVDAARDRMARMVCADRDGFSADDARALALAADEALLARLEAAARRATKGIGPPRAAVISGSGDFLARRLADRLLAADGVTIELRQAWGQAASSAGCAHALLELAREHDAAEWGGPHQNGDESA